MARNRAGKSPVEVEFLPQSAEEPLPLVKASIDTAVVTWTLFSIPNPSEALRQAKRVLEPSGRLIFVKHGRSSDADVVVWQDRITPAWKRIGGGCHLNRKIDDLITGAGFQIVELRTNYLPGTASYDLQVSGIRASGVRNPSWLNHWSGKRTRLNSQSAEFSGSQLFVWLLRLLLLS